MWRFSFASRWPRGTAVKLTLTYEGNDVCVQSVRCAVALATVGTDVGIFDDPRDLLETFASSARNDLSRLRTGRERTEGGQKIALWRSQQPFVSPDSLRRFSEDVAHGCDQCQRRVYVTRDPESPTWQEFRWLIRSIRQGLAGSISARHRSPVCRSRNRCSCVSQQSGRHWSFCLPYRFVATGAGTQNCWRPACIAGPEGVRDTVAWHEVAHHGGSPGRLVQLSRSVAPEGSRSSRRRCCSK